MNMAVRLVDSNFEYKNNTIDKFRFQLLIAEKHEMLIYSDFK